MKNYNKKKMYMRCMANIKAQLFVVCVMRVESPQTGKGKGLDDVVELLYKDLDENREKTFPGKQFILYPKNWNPKSSSIPDAVINNAKRRALIAHNKNLNTIEGDFEEILKKLQKPN